MFCKTISLLTLGLAALVFVPQPAQAQTAQVSQKPVLTTLHRFDGPHGDNTHGNNALTLGKDGNFYGVTYASTNGGGTIYKMAPSGKFTTLWQFTADPVNGYVQGCDPVGTLAQGPDGNFYGATQYGGGLYDDNDNTQGGTVFRITPQGRLTTLAVFGRNGGPTSPISGVTVSPDATIYGTTPGGGTYNYGTVYRVDKNGVLSELCTFEGYGDGGIPYSAPLFVPAHDGQPALLYGTTHEGGAGDSGGVFVRGYGGSVYVLPAYGVGSGSPGTVYGFEQGGPFSGVSPVAGLTLGPDGTLYGVTEQGGLGDEGFFKTYGVAFKIKGGQYTEIHHFSSDGHGTNPSSNLTLGPDGNLYGTTPYGGTNDRGTVFQMTPQGHITTLYKFHTAFDGTRPAGTVTFGPDGALYGTTAGGGAKGYGTVYKLTLPQ